MNRHTLPPQHITTTRYVIKVTMYRIKTAGCSYGTTITRIQSCDWHPRDQAGAEAYAVALCEYQFKGWIGVVMNLRVGGIRRDPLE